MTIKLVIWEVLCAALFWSVFCRSVRVDKTTKIDIRVVIFLVGLGALLGLGAPLYGWEPDWVTLLIIGSIAAMQVVTAQHWGSAVPDQFVMSRFLPRERRKGDRI